MRTYGIGVDWKRGDGLSLSPGEFGPD